MRLVKLVDNWNVKIYLNPRFVKSIEVYNEPTEHVIIHTDTKSSITVYDQPSLKRLGQLFGLD